MATPSTATCRADNVDVRNRKAPVGGSTGETFELRDEVEEVGREREGARRWFGRRNRDSPPTLTNTVRLGWNV